MTLDDVSSHKAAAEELLGSLDTERKILRNSLKAMKRKGDENQAAALKAQIGTHSGQIKELRKEIRLCGEISERAEDMKLRLEYAKEYRSGKENEIDEYIGRRGRAGREDEPRSR